ncbi:unnamed protein product [Citrullus colocynthis]|uniref:Uncharacterized protein n=1 Tax=Citrullus colocynthis TaxID=252529 RepID=A0ABP0Z2H2_9ROSI
MCNNVGGVSGGVVTEVAKFMSVSLSQLYSFLVFSLLTWPVQLVLSHLFLLILWGCGMSSSASLRAGRYDRGYTLGQDWHISIDVRSWGLSSFTTILLRVTKLAWTRFNSITTQRLGRALMLPFVVACN